MHSLVIKCCKTNWLLKSPKVAQNKLNLSYQKLRKTRVTEETQYFEKFNTFEFPKVTKNIQKSYKNRIFGDHIQNTTFSS
jgi:hypothetical protein